jgi:hypothetical protein
MMHGREKSDSAIVAGKPANKAVSTSAEPVERRSETERAPTKHAPDARVTGAGACTENRRPLVFSPSSPKAGEAMGRGGGGCGTFIVHTNIIHRN